MRSLDIRSFFIVMPLWSSNTMMAILSVANKTRFSIHFSQPVPMGTGLGLSISFMVVKNRDGRIEVESAVDQGPTFHMYLYATGSGSGIA
jgi:K+-sensing histidine kinase KdpD